MNGLPLHPILVHLPLGLCMVMPVIALCIALGIRKKLFTAKLWLLVVVLQAVVFGSAFAAMKAGGHEEEKVEKIVAEKFIHEHEEAGETFVMISGIILGIAVLGLFSKKSFGQLAIILTVLASIASVILAIEAGHSGGSLVYLYGAGKAYQVEQGSAPAQGTVLNVEDKDDDED